MTTMTPAPTIEPSPRSRALIDETLWNRLINRITDEQGVDRPYAERIMGQTLAFLWLCARRPNQSFAPSETVDIGWHAFILHTRAYSDFCTRIAGTFIHHDPSTGADHDAARAVAETVRGLSQLGLEVDEPLWTVRADCGGNKCASCTAPTHSGS